MAPFPSRVAVWRPLKLPNEVHVAPAWLRGDPDRDAMALLRTVGKLSLVLDEVHVSFALGALPHVRLMARREGAPEFRAAEAELAGDDGFLIPGLHVVFHEGAFEQVVWSGPIR
jgi:hypothetical protein